MNATHSRNVGGGCRVGPLSNTGRGGGYAGPLHARFCWNAVDPSVIGRRRGGGVWKAVMPLSASKRVLFMVALVRLTVSVANAVSRNATQWGLKCRSDWARMQAIA